MRIAPGIEAYGGGGFRVAGVRFEGSILILDDVVSRWPVATVLDLSPDAVAAVIANRDAVEFVLLGMGPTTQPPPRAVREVLARAGLGLEVMNTKEAVRLYNVLAAEGRRMAAALIAFALEFGSRSHVDRETGCSRRRNRLSFAEGYHKGGLWLAFLQIFATP